MVSDKKHIKTTRERDKGFINLTARGRYINLQLVNNSVYTSRLTTYATYDSKDTPVTSHCSVHLCFARM